MADTRIEYTNCKCLLHSEITFSSRRRHTWTAEIESVDRVGKYSMKDGKKEKSNVKKNREETSSQETENGGHRSRRPLKRLCEKN